MADLLARVTGAIADIHAGSGKRRFGEGATDKLAPLSNAKPARYPHADNTDTSATGLVEMVGAFVDGIDLSAYLALCAVQHVASCLGAATGLSARGVRCTDGHASRTKSP